MRKKIKSVLLVDGYNIIFAWDDLRKISESSLEDARLKLADMLCNYQGFKKTTEIILIFDGYKTPGNVGEIIHYHNIDIVYTKEAQTADTFIESLSYQMSQDYHIAVATGDALEQIVIFTGGATRMTARELREAIDNANKEIQEVFALNAKRQKTRYTLLESLPEETRKMLSELRLKED
ncbi:MAG: NYN domain-containing protein [Lachnospiraceae bacterium]|nr:NYN domain-containing protein [Lachnospiraceae bacterium]